MTHRTGYIRARAIDMCGGAPSRIKCQGVSEQMKSLKGSPRECECEREHDPPNDSVGKKRYPLNSIASMSGTPRLFLLDETS